MLEHAGDQYEAVTFGAPGVDFLGSPPPDPRMLHYEVDGDPVPDILPHRGTTVHFDTELIYLINPINYHAKELYLALVEFTTQEAISAGIDGDDVLSWFGNPRELAVFAHTEDTGGGTYAVAAGPDVADDVNELDDLPYVIFGGGGNDRLNGTETFPLGVDKNDVLFGGAGNDLLDGQGGVDRMYGGSGNETYQVDEVGDLVIERNGIQEGIDTVYSSLDDYTLPANVENLVLKPNTGLLGIDEPLNGTGNELNNVISGNNAANRLRGGSGNDTLNGGSGADTLVGGSGNDTYAVNSWQDVVTEASGKGTDLVQSTVTGSSGYTLPVDVENLTLLGSANLNGTGNELKNVLTGNSGKNTLNGGSGNDVLKGLEGADVLTGGAGKDIFDFDTVTDSFGATGATRDTIKDFKGSEFDKIDLSTFDAKAGGSVNEEFKFIGTKAFSSNATGQLRFDADKHVLLGSTDSDRDAEFSILLTGVNYMTGANFIL